MTAVRLAPISLRAKIMAIIVGGAIVPLALIGAWLTASGARSGRELLRRELDASLLQLTDRIRDRWERRSAEIELLANNESARRLLASHRQDTETTTYLEEVAGALSSSIREFTYRDVTGRARWSSGDAATRSTSALDARRGFIGIGGYEAIFVRRGVVDSAGRSLGSVDARILLSALLPTDSLQLIVAGAALRIRDREHGETIGGQLEPDDGATFVSTRSSLNDPPLDFELIASDARYVQPFARAARLGLGFLLGVSVLVMALTAFLTRRLTGALEQMVDAAGAVAAGDLDRTVTGRGGAEVSRLAAAFNTMTESLRLTLRQLSQREALAAVGEFAASISHEVRNALTAVRLDLQRLSERLTVPADRTLVRRLLGNVQRLDSIVTGSLRIARTDPATMRPVVLEGVVRAAITAAEPTFVETVSRVELDSPDADVIRLRADPAALEHMLLNLLMNAAQAMTAGGVARVAISRVDGHAVVRIADTGRGIPAEILPRLGERFFSSRPGGTGLGFAIARQIAVAHGGDVRVTKTGTTGTEVEVLLAIASCERQDKGEGRRDAAPTATLGAL